MPVVNSLFNSAQRAFGATNNPDNIPYQQGTPGFGGQNNVDYGNPNTLGGIGGTLPNIFGSGSLFNQAQHAYENYTNQLFGGTGDGTPDRTKRAAGLLAVPDPTLIAQWWKVPNSDGVSKIP